MGRSLFNTQRIVKEVGISRGSGQTFNKEYYLEILRRLRDAVRKKRPEMWTEKNWQLHHNNAAAHFAHVVKGFLAKNNTALMRPPPYSPDLAPFDFWLFPQVKTTLKGTLFQSRKNITEKTMAELRIITEEEFKRCFQKWQRRWGKMFALARGVF